MIIKIVIIAAVSCLLAGWKCESHFTSHVQVNVKSFAAFKSDVQLVNFVERMNVGSLSSMQHLNVNRLHESQASLTTRTAQAHLLTGGLEKTECLVAAFRGRAGHCRVLGYRGSYQLGCRSGIRLPVHSTQSAEAVNQIRSNWLVLAGCCHKVKV